jgi:hypothetical protein
MQFIQALWDFALAHPALVAAVLLALWPLITALVTAFFGAADKYAESHPRFHIVLSLMETAGFNSRGVIAWLARFLPKAPPGSGVALLLVAIGWGCVAITNVREFHARAPRALPVLSLEACTGNAQQDAKTANDWINGFLNSASYACTQLSQVSDVQQLALVCGIINMGDKLAPAVEHFIESLILGRQAALANGMMFDHAGAVWFKPVLDGGAQ